MFKKILIANRGEIACRIIKTARRMRIKTVAVFSEADREALHVHLADEAVCIGEAPATASYLQADTIITACRQTGAEAVHPGYGFLSENVEFAQRLAQHDIVFIGPPANAIQTMGDKLASKKLALEAGVNTIPGYDGIIQDSDHALAIAHEIGYPVMLKASAGGGGKGMRVARNDAECVTGFSLAASEAQTAFGDDRILIEKFIENPRHIEIQIIADTFGNTFYLGERECSIQRRHQKVLEEAPSPFLDRKTREAMGQQAVQLARAVGYYSAGTVECIVDRQKNFYFLEMNTRLQVEHPVTEMVYGLDLVELMIRVAAGQDLRLDQEQLKSDGWAIEARIYAENPCRNFLPSSGRLVHYLPPEEDDRIRVDTGIYEGSEVSIHYDPMIAKLIAHGETRIEATIRLREALDAFYIRGVAHNINFLQAILAHPRFVDGGLSTNFIAEEYPQGFSAADIPHEQPEWFICTAAVIHRRYMERAARISGQLPGHEKTVPSDWVVVLGGENHPVSVSPTVEGYEVQYAGRGFHLITSWKLGQPLFRATINGTPVCLQFERPGLNYLLTHGGVEANVIVMAPKAAALNEYMLEKQQADLSQFLLSPMPGLLTSIAVNEGDEVKAGEELAVIEAMKMANTLRADRDAIVSKILAQPGDSLAVDQAILEFAPTTE